MEPSQTREIAAGGKRTRVLELADAAMAEVGQPPGRIRWNSDIGWWQFHTSVPQETARRALLLAMSAVYGRGRPVPCLRCTRSGSASPCITVGEALMTDDHVAWSAS